MQASSRSAWLDALTRPIWFAPILFALAATLSYIYADRNVPPPDEGAMLTAAVKILRGAVYYRDVDAYMFPGATYLLAGAMSIFGEHLAVARALAGGIFCAMVLGLYACALALIDPKRAALCGLAVLSLKFYAFPVYSMVSYPDPAFAAAVIGLALFLRHDFDGASTKLFWVGILVGFSIVMKQSAGIGVATVFGVVLCFPGFAHGPRRRPRRLRELALYGVGLLIPIAVMSVYFASHGVFGEMVYSGLVRPFTGYLPTSGISFLPPLAWWQFGDLQLQGSVYIPLHYQELISSETLPGRAMQGFYADVGEFFARLSYTLIPIVFGICSGYWLRAFCVADAAEADPEAASLARGRFFTAAGVSLALTVSAFPRADTSHVMTIYPAILLMLFAIASPSRIGRGWTAQIESIPRLQLRRARCEAVAVMVVSIVTLVLAAAYDATLSVRLSMERADLWVRPQDTWVEGLVEYIDDNVPEGEPLFVYGHEAHWYFLSDRYTPRRFAQLYPGMTDDETGEVLAEMIRESRPPVVVFGVLEWPGTPRLRDYTQELVDTIDELYVEVPDAVADAPDSWILRVLRPRQRASRPDS